MAKPRVFVSSTFYDLRHLRERLHEFIEDLGYEPILSEIGAVPYDPKSAPAEACCEEVRRCHILVLVIGGRYGSTSTAPASVAGTEHAGPTSSPDTQASITEREWTTAIQSSIPVYTLIDRAVLNEYRTYCKNRDNPNVVWDSVDNVAVFRLIDKLLNLPNNNPMSPFERADDIIMWLRAQWAGLFEISLRQRFQDDRLLSLQGQIEKLSDVVSTIMKHSVLTATPQSRPSQDATHSRATNDPMAIEASLAARVKKRFLEHDLATNLGLPKKLSADSILETLRKATDYIGFFEALGFTMRKDADGVETFHFYPTSADEKYLYFGSPERTFKMLRAAFVVE